MCLPQQIRFRDDHRHHGKCLPGGDTTPNGLFLAARGEGVIEAQEQGSDFF